MSFEKLPVVFYGGTFDPPHLGHKKTVEFVLNSMPVEKICIMPAFVPPHKSISDASSYEDRLAMTKLLFHEKHSSLEVSDLESGLPKPSYSYRTLHSLSRLYPDHPIYALVGRDSYDNLSKWESYDKLREYRFIVLHRSTDDNESLENHSDILLENPEWNVSSAQIRQEYSGFYKTGKMSAFLKKWVPDDIHEYIFNHRLYEPK